MRSTTIVTVPGYHGSNEKHWQSWLERTCPDVSRVSGIDWEQPHLFAWAGALEKHLDKLPGQVILVSHSFGALVSALVAHWRADKVAGLILAAPASPERFSLKGCRHEDEDSISGFLPETSLDTLGVLIGSENDPWLALNDAKQLSQQWGLAFFNAGKAGHINVDSGYGEWPLLREFVDALTDAIEPLPGDDISHLSSWNRSRRINQYSPTQPVPLQRKAVNLAYA